MAKLPKSTNTGSSTSAKANEQKGKKQCTQCHAQKKITDFYYSNSPRYSLDQRVPMCKDCCKTSALNKDGTINFEDLKDLLRNIDKPLYFDLLYTSEKSVKKENSYLSDEEVAFHGLEILQKYFTFVAARQDKSKSYSDAEKEGFIHQNSNRSKEEKEEILAKYSDLITQFSIRDKSIEKINTQKSGKKIIWSDKDIQNRNYAIEVVGYDPFDEYPEDGRKFLFNQLSPYLEDDANVDDAYKLSQILQIIKNNFQIDTCDKKMAQLDPLKDADSIKTLSSIKNQLVQSNDKIAKENEISVKNRSDKAAGKSTLTYLMRDLREKDFDKAEADYYDQLRSTGTRWAVDMSIKSIKQNGIFDENDKKEIYEMQLDLIDSLNQQVDDLKEKVRLLLLENDKLKAGIANGI